MIAGNDANPDDVDESRRHRRPTDSDDDTITVAENIVQDGQRPRTRPSRQCATDTDEPRTSTRSPALARFRSATAPPAPSPSLPPAITARRRRPAPSRSERPAPTAPVGRPDVHDYPDRRRRGRHGAARNTDGHRTTRRRDAADNTAVGTAAQTIDRRRSPTSTTRTRPSTSSATPTIATSSRTWSNSPSTDADDRTTRAPRPARSPSAPTPTASTSTSEHQITLTDFDEPTSPPPTDSDETANTVADGRRQRTTWSSSPQHRPATDGTANTATHGDHRDDHRRATEAARPSSRTVADLGQRGRDREAGEHLRAPPVPTGRRPDLPHRRLSESDVASVDHDLTASPTAAWPRPSPTAPTPSGSPPTAATPTRQRQHLRPSPPRSCDGARRHRRRHDHRDRHGHRRQRGDGRIPDLRRDRRVRTPNEGNGGRRTYAASDAMTGRRTTLTYHHRQ